MTAIGRTNHAFFFDGVSDSILVPEGAFSAIGSRNPEGGSDVTTILSDQVPNAITSATGHDGNQITIEAWLMPDCGGTIIEKDNQFKLSLGNVDTPGPAEFTVYLQNQGDLEAHKISTASLVSAGNRYEGTVYPNSDFGGIHDYYNRFDTSTYGLATDLNKNHRPLIHVVAAVQSDAISLFVNGQLMAKKSIEGKNLAMRQSNSNVYIGGRGGQFRGVMEAIHISRSFSMSMVNGNCPLPNRDTMLLYRFEEPINTIEKTYTFSSLTGGYDTNTLSTITLSSSDAKELATTLTGNTVTSGTIDFTASPYSSGKYEIYDASTGATVKRYIPHVPYNLLINPGAINTSTKKPNGTAPERVRLHSINTTTGVLTISSIHLDHSVDTNDGLIGVIHKTRTTDVDNHFVVIGADLLIDGKSGKPYQPPHYNTQIIDRTGQMVIDESEAENHGFVFSSRMATTVSDTSNPFAAAWPVDPITGEELNSGWKQGHSGRHANSHVDGHSFLAMLPESNEEIVDLRGNGKADLIDLVYGEMQSGVDKQIPVNSRLDIYRQLDDTEIHAVHNTGTVTVAVNSFENTTSPPAGKRELIAIGGIDFDFTPFVLKGPVPRFDSTYDSSVRNYHLTPSKTSRVALLHVPQLTSTTNKFAPYVEVHYNAIDLTGESMYPVVAATTTSNGNQYIIVSSGNTDYTQVGASDSNVGTIFTATGGASGTGTVRRYMPMLMVEKTVPAGNVATGGGSYVYDAIIASLASGKTLYSPGGAIDISTLSSNYQNMMDTNNLIGDNSEGYSADADLDESLTPANYTPRATSTSVNKTPSVILESVSSTGAHESVFNRMVLGKTTSSKTLTDKGAQFRLEPDTVVGSPSAGQFDEGVVSAASPIHEMFDVIDNFYINDNVSDTRVVIQPSDRRRTNQLSSLKTSLNSANEVNTVSPLFMLSRARVRGVEETEGEAGSFTTIRCVGLSETATNRSVNFTGTGSPDSHIVKEIEPNSPVVTVTLGGPGQGAIDTKPVFQHSILAHETYSTKRAYALTATKLDANFTSNTHTLNVEPLNNKSTSFSSWGTYGFPQVGRIYLPDGSSAKYASKTGTSFTFNLATAGSGDYVSARGNEFTSITQLLEGLGLMSGETSGSPTWIGNFTLYNEPDFGQQSSIENGSTVNDRMHQSMSDVSHDYQLGTQYASTRALVEIPVFSQQFFHNNVGPDNSFKIHLDATHTAHTWNPNPVGRRFGDKEPADRESQSAYAFAIANNSHVESAIITGWDLTNQRITISDPKIFPTSTTTVVAATATVSSYEYIIVSAGNTDFTQIGAADNNVGTVFTANGAGSGTGTVRLRKTMLGNMYRYQYRRVFTSKGDWAWYNNDPATDGYIQLETTDYSKTEDFLAQMKVGNAVYVGGPSLGDAIPLASDDYTPSSDFEDRDEFYYDAANVKTQGGNVDYGLRQYVTAVEFKAGPETNPHAPRVSTRRASGVVQAQEEIVLDSGKTKAIVITMSDDDFIKFPNLGYDSLEDVPGGDGDGTLQYVVEYDDGTNVHEYQYHGNIKTLNSTTSVSENSILLVYYDYGYTSTYPDSLVGTQITLAGRRRKTSPPIATDALYRYDSTYNNPLYKELMASTRKVGTIPAQGSATTTVTLTGIAKRNMNDLHGYNLKTDDVLYLRDTSNHWIKKLGVVSKIASANASGEQVITLDANCPTTSGTLEVRVDMGQYEDVDAILNATWINPYCGGGIRNGDTVWANMSFNNPYAIEGLFAKSRGVYNESQVWKEFDGGVGSLADNPRDSIPLENFLIGDTCLETAQNYVQHVNRTIEENTKALGLGVGKAHTVAYIDPYLSNDDHARVLLYDVDHDREFIALQDIHMQVQTSPDAAQIGWPKEVVEQANDTTTELHMINAAYNGAAPSPWTTQIDVANGYPSQNRYIRSTQQSKFIESAYAHDLANRHSEDLLDSTTFANLTIDLPTDGRKIAGSRLYGKAHGHHIHTGYSYGSIVDGFKTGNSTTRRTSEETVLYKAADKKHSMSRVPLGSVDSFTKKLIKWRTNEGTGYTFRDPSTFFDTPDGTRVIPAFLCLRGIRSTQLDLSLHSKARLKNLKQWTDMDFVRRLTVDLGEVSRKDSVTNVLSAAEEIVRMINQHSALSARTESGSAHDPSPFWDKDKGDKGTHMGYLRAHIGREVEDLNGDKGISIVIHSTVPGASGRNFCAWLDNSKGQTVYQPQFLIGHGGRWRNFWALPEEGEGENMHPAPMPLNKHGRPFAPVTTLQQYISSDESGEKVSSVAEFDDSPVLRATSDSISGKSNNSILPESLDVKGSSSSLVKGLKVGKGAIARVNLGGLVASGVPGWAPNAGKWGMGRKNDTDLLNRYGISDITSGYTSHVPSADVIYDKVGTAPIYGFRFKDNTGVESGIRLIYKRSGDSFANDNTTLPNTIEDEVCVFFNDRSVTEGGFTIGNHMHGSGDATGRSTMTGSAVGWFGNEWRGVPSPSIVSEIAITWSNTNSTATTGSITNWTSHSLVGRYNDLSIMGYPKENGVFQASQHTGTIGTVHSYTKRVGNVFYGVTPAMSTGTYLMSPVLNWTTIVTDELLAAVAAAALNAGDEINSPTGLKFDCTNMYATDGRTFGEWGVSENAITIRAFNPKKPIRPLNTMFRASLHRDMGIKAAHLEFGEMQASHQPNQAANTGNETEKEWFFGLTSGTEKGRVPYTNADIDSGKNVDCGYVPYTLLQVTTMGKGPNCNTASPILVDSQNTPVDVSTWRENLKGSRFTKTLGDHILPKIDNPMSVLDASETTVANMTSQGDTDQFETTDGKATMGMLLPDAGTSTSPQGLTVSEQKRIYFTENISALATFFGRQYVRLDNASKSDDFPVATAPSTKAFNTDAIFSLFADKARSKEFAGFRTHGSVFSEPIVYFRGGKSSRDHSVPLFFGGGFSGVVMDVNDGTTNDYSSFYTHPYANGPMGVSGLQNASEISTSHSILDCNAMFAFFPGAALCNQHRGSITPPAFNKNNVLSPDLHSGYSKYSAGVVKAKPVPLVLRFAHPTARYDDHVDGVDIENKTTYMIFGPGQAFPFTKEVQDDGDTGVDGFGGVSWDSTLGSNRFEPHPGRVVTVGNSWSNVPLNSIWPNSIGNTDNELLPPDSAYYNATAGWHWRAMVNWETPAGYSMKGKWNQRPSHGRHYGQQFNDYTPYDISGTAQIGVDLRPIHPKMHTPMIGFGITMAADTVWHMDGGYHPGGSWLDNQLTFNPPHPKKVNSRITGATTKSGGGGADWERAGQLHPTAFRMSGVLTGKILDYLGGEHTPGGQGSGYSADTVHWDDVDMDYIVVDATRCQNGEELATVLGAAINAFPGAGALKALGGTHMPSMGNAMRQDRYGWIDLGTLATYSTDTVGNYVDSGTTDGSTTFTQAYLEKIPASGWLRAHDTSANKTSWACYHSREVLNPSSSNWKVRFYLAPNRIEGENRPESPNTWENFKETDGEEFPTWNTDYDTLAVWSKTGVIRFNNENASARDHMTQVHFSGIADAIDRTRPIGAVGWHGERYSYLNSLKITTSVTTSSSTTQTHGYSAGLGAYHPMLAFSPYGSAGTVMSLYSKVPVVTPIFGSPESTPTIDGLGNYLGRHIQKQYFYEKFNLTSGSGNAYDTYAYEFKDTDETGNWNQWAQPTNYSTTLPVELALPQGVSTSAFLVVSYEAETALLEKKNRDGIEALGDWLHLQGNPTNNKLHYAGTTKWDTRIHDDSRFLAPANAGPNVEALITDVTLPATGGSSNWATSVFSGNACSYFHSALVTQESHIFDTAKDLSLKNATPDYQKTGDLVFDLDHSVGSILMNPDSAERNTSKDYFSNVHTTNWPQPYWHGDVNAFGMYGGSAAKNFTIENIVWKRMDGGNLSLPSSNARGLGGVPWMGDSGETLLGNVRFSFETTNSAMMPVLQAQELAQPELMRKHAYSVRNVLTIPNEEIQFQSITVVDDAGQEHKIEGGSPLGTIIRGFRTPTDRGTDGKAPALANSGNVPNLKVQLPDPNSIPGNIVVRSGFDPIQGYQHETLGSGGMQHPDLDSSYTGHLFNNTVSSPRMSPTYEDHNWERINPVTFDSELGAWNNNAPLSTSYELHDRTLYFHVCKMGNSHSRKRDGLFGVTSWDAVNGNLKVTNTITTSIYGIDSVGFGDKEVLGGRRFISMYDVATDEGVVLSYTSLGSSGVEYKWFKGVVGDVGLAAFLDKYFTLNETTNEYEPKGTVRVAASYYIPGGSTRFFAARRLRDHAEVSGNSPDMAHTQYFHSFTDATCDVTNNDATITMDSTAKLYVGMRVDGTGIPDGATVYQITNSTTFELSVNATATNGNTTLTFGETLAYDAYRRPKLTPMPFPRMGHHFVTPTMPMLPGHWAHPAYQSLYKRHLNDYNMQIGFTDSAIIADESTLIKNKADMVSDGVNLSARVNPMEPEINFSGINAAPSGPSDIHGGAFTLMFETGLKYDGYGVLASVGTWAGDVNKAGGHSIVLEAAANYSLDRHFPDPEEVGAYQIVIQPNLFGNQLVGFHDNSTTRLTSQQINTVVGIRIDAPSRGALTLVLAKETGADTRGCEIFVNEAILDINPDHGSQFTNIPPLMSYNPLGTQLTESPSFTRRGFPYSTMFSDASPGYTLNIPWWSILHATDPSANSGTYTKLSQYAPEDYYQLCRNTFGSIGKQLTINGYTSIYLDIYSSISQSISIIPKTTVVNYDNASGRIQVDDATLFPLETSFSPVLEYTGKNGKKYSKALLKRSGSDFDINKGDYLQVAGGSDAFWSNLYIGAVLRLSYSYNTIPIGNLLKDKKRSVFANILPQIIDGNQDTNSGYIPDAFLCMWHPNLGRPNTYFSDSRTTFGGNAIDKKQYNSMPEHFETIHYHDFAYAIGYGPFNMTMKYPDEDKDGTLTNGNRYGLWPCGSRGGPQASDLGYYGYVSSAWNVHATTNLVNYAPGGTNRRIYDGDDSGGSYVVGGGSVVAGLGITDRSNPYLSYRFGVLQASNRPRYGTLPARMLYENTANVEGKNTTDADTGPLVQMESTDWVWGGNSTSSSTFPVTYVGVMERQTNFAGMLGHDKPEMQVRYSDGRRMTRPFGTPVRTLRSTKRDWWGDSEGKGISSLSEASQYYLVDWWGNERGEDVRRAPVRGFGIRPAWDCGDAYEYDRRNNRSPYRRVWNNGKPVFNMKGIVNMATGDVSISSGTIPRMGGKDNDANLNGNNNDLVDVFAPTHALRVGDMGNGRGVRYPTAFNEDVLTELSTPIHKTGVVLSHNTAEPLFGNGLLRPSNELLQADEVKRGISARLGIDDNGLIKTEAVPSDRVENIVGDSPHKIAVSRTSPRIGLDAEVAEGVEQNHIVINTEAHSLHTDRNVGQRVTLLGASKLVAGASTLTDADYTSVNFSRQAGGSPDASVHKFSHTNPFRPYGGTYILEARNYAGFFNDTGWGVANLTGSTKTSNPYQDTTWKTNTQRNNESDSVVKFMLRPVRVLDKQHVEIFRPHSEVHSSSAQYAQNYLTTSAGGKYGIFTYETTNGRTDTNNLMENRTVPNANGPYLPIFSEWDSAREVPTGKGPNIPGTEVAGFSNSLLSTVSTLVISENTLQHHRSDAPRRRQEKDTDAKLGRPDYSVTPRFSQSLHGKGHKGDVSYGISDHTGDGA